VLGLPERPAEAEYDPRRDEVEPGVFNSEEYNLEILELPVGTPIRK